MINIPIEAIPNQKFGVRVEGTRWEFEIKAIEGSVAVTIYRDDVLVLAGMRATAGTPLIPYQYLERGNFIFVTENDEVPHWSLFGTTQSLQYITIGELETLRYE